MQVLRLAIGGWSLFSWLVFIVRISMDSDIMVHFTNWVWLLQATYWSLEWYFYPHSPLISIAFLTPVVCASEILMILAVVFMMLNRAELFQDALADYDEATMNLGNTLVHELPVVLFILYNALVVVDRLYRDTQLFFDQCRKRNKLGFYFTSLFAIQAIWIFCYYSWFSVQSRYGLHHVKDDVSVGTSLAVVWAVLIAYLFWVRLPKRPASMH